MEDALRSYGQDMLVGATPVEAVGRPMAWRFNGEDVGDAPKAQR
ncbi:hypothetical protein ONO86_05657 [Micromonospora noduli]|nr:hypothetical protein [Micromonospora noduli]RAO30104.1 hypothetical protein ONO86_05657 [Micromonospora noduli]